MADPREPLPESPEGDVALDVRPRKAPRYLVVFHNDDYTTRDFVVEVLQRFFGLNETAATHVMLSVHHKGRGVAGV